MRRRGRSLDATRDDALRAGALDLVAEIGYDRFTVDGLAPRAHSSKTTIYRRWAGKGELIVDALTSRRGMPVVPDTGSLRSDLDATAHGSVGMDSRFDARLTMGLISALAHHTELRQVFRRRLVDPRTAALKQTFERAVARGEVAEDRDLDLLASLFPALMIQHLVTTGEIPDAQFAERVMHAVILPLATCPNCLTTPPVGSD